MPIDLQLHTITADLETLDVRVPVVHLGSAGPRVVLTACVHGDEVTGFRIVQRIAHLLGDREIACRLDLVVVANPLAFLAGERKAPLDGGDLNRSGAADAAGYTGDLARWFLHFVDGADMVINLHALEAAGQVMGIYYEGTPDRASGPALDLLEALEPDFVWFIPVGSDVAAKYQQSLDSRLLSMGIPCTSLELSHSSHSTNRELDVLAGRIAKVLSTYGSDVVSPSGEGRSRLRFMTRKGVYAERVGVWESNVTLGQLADLGQGMGSVTTPSLSVTEAKSPIAGEVVEIRAPGLVRPGDRLVSIGVSVPGA